MEERIPTGKLQDLPPALPHPHTRSRYLQYTVQFLRYRSASTVATVESTVVAYRTTVWYEYPVRCGILYRTGTTGARTYYSKHCTVLVQYE